MFNLPIFAKQIHWSIIGQGKDILHEFVLEFLIRQLFCIYLMQSKTIFCTLRVEFHPKAILPWFWSVHLGKRINLWVVCFLVPYTRISTLIWKSINNDSKIFDIFTPRKKISQKRKNQKEVLFLSLQRIWRKTKWTTALQTTTKRRRDRGDKEHTLQVSNFKNWKQHLLATDIPIWRQERKLLLGPTSQKPEFG